VSSPVTLAECLVFPHRLGQSEHAHNFNNLIVNGSNTVFVSIDQTTAAKAAKLRARYNLSLLDAFQVAAALLSDCDAFLTNDRDFKRVTEMDMIVLDKIDPLIAVG